MKRVSVALFNLIFPDECRLCEQQLIGCSRIPVCVSCLSLPQPLEVEFFCRSCRTPFVEAYPLDENGLCTICRENAVRFDCAYSFGSFEGSLQQLIHLFKYGKVETLAEPLSQLMLRALPRDLDFDFVMAMPMHWRRQWERGFNQAELLASPVAKRFGLKCARNLSRKRYTKSQASLDERERRANLRDSFRVTRPEQIAGKRILLIDDVLTTGATLRAAAEALKSAGAGYVSVLTLARVDRRGSYANSTPSAKSRPRQVVLTGTEAS